MTILEASKISLKGIRTNKKRAFMTMLGIIIGVAAVIVIISVGAGAQSLIINEIAAYGSNLFGVLPGASDEDGPPASVMGITVTTLKLDEVDDLKEIPHVEAVTAYVRGIDTLTYHHRKTDATFVGVNASLAQVESLTLKNGRFFTKNEVSGLSKVVVLGHAVKTELFAGSPAIGETVKIKKNNFKVIGVMDKMGTVAFENKDELVYIPVTVAQKQLLGINHLALIRGKVDQSQNLPFVIGEVKKTIRHNHNIQDPKNDDFSVRSLNQALNVITSITDAIRFFLAGIAAISLIVGGIGIMNIMLVNVVERTKEIGLRKSVGATTLEIIKQFLIESATITLIGGIIGIILGLLVSFLVAIIVSQLGYNWDFILSPLSILLGLGISGGIGLVFGSYPAYQAAKLEPVQALRNE